MAFKYSNDFKAIIVPVIEKIELSGQLFALIIRANYSADGIQFFTPKSFSQQIGYMKRPKGYLVQPHIHNRVNRDVSLTQEVLFIKSGKVKMTIYTEDQKPYFDTEVSTGDCILLASGGHSFEMLEESEIIEVKTGPHVGEEDKTRFEV